MAAQRGEGNNAAAHLIYSGLHITCVCCCHGLQCYGMLTAHFHLPNLQYNRPQLKNLAVYTLDPQYSI